MVLADAFDAFLIAKTMLRLRLTLFGNLTKRQPIHGWLQAWLLEGQPEMKHVTIDIKSTFGAC